MPIHHGSPEDEIGEWLIQCGEDVKQIKLFDSDTLFAHYDEYAGTGYNSKVVG